MSHIKNIASSNESSCSTSSNIKESSINQKYKAAFSKLLFTRIYFKHKKDVFLEGNVKNLNEFNELVIKENEENQTVSYLVKFACFNLKANDKIRAADLLDDEGAFNLLKYIRAYKEINSNNEIKDSTLKKFIIFTNVPFDFEKDTTTIVDRKIEFNDKAKDLNKNQILQIKSDNVAVDYFEIKGDKVFTLLWNKIKPPKKTKSSKSQAKLEKALHDLDYENIGSALRNLIFAVVHDDTEQFEKSVNQQIMTEFKHEMPNSVLKNFDDFIIKNLIDKDTNAKLTYDDAYSLINKHVKIGTLEGLHGSMYAVGFSMLVFCRAYFRKLTNFVLESEVKEAAKFDDVVFSEDDKQYQFLQLKRKKDVLSGKISGKDIFSDLTGDYNLLKYVCSYWIIKNSNRFQDLSIKNAIVFTNISMGSENKMLLNVDGIDVKKVANKYKMWYDDLKEINLDEEMVTDNDILKIKNFPVKYYKFREPRVVEILLRQIETFKKPDTKDEIMVALNKLDAQSIEEALNNIVFAVNQPDEPDLFELVEKEIQEYFNLENVNTVVIALKENFIKWFQGKSMFPPRILYPIIEDFFQSHIKTFQDEIPPPSSRFVGRENELKKIKENLKEYGIVEITQSQVDGVTELGGIGKSELAKKFVSLYKNSDYYNRIIWINSENQTNITMKIDRIVNKLGIVMPNHEALDEIKEIKHKINTIIDYFKDMKMLFVFDNAENENDSYEILSYFIDHINELSYNCKPHILITTRAKKYIIPHIDLNVLSTDEAIALIKNSISNHFHIKKIEATRLVTALHCFPLKITEAITCIIDEYEAAQNIEVRYNIYQYLREYCNWKPST